MAISSTVRKAGPFTGTGTTGPFTFTFKVFNDTDVYCVKALTSTGAETALALTTDYTVSLNSDQETSPGGTVTLVSALEAEYTLTITSNIGYLQSLVLTNLGGFYAETINDALDKIVIQIQQVSEQVSRSAKIPISSTADADELSADILYLVDNWTMIQSALTTIAAFSNGNVSALAGLTGAANKLPYFTALDTLALTDLTAFGRSLTGAANAAAVLTLLGIPDISVANYRIPTGKVDDYMGASAPEGWVLACGKTIGDSSSGATERANADTEDLFTLLWTDWTDVTAPLFTSAGSASTRGATAAADWAEHKRMTVPDIRGQVIAGLDNLGGASANRVTDSQADTLGGVLGEESETNSHTASSSASGTGTNLSDGNALPTTVSTTNHTHVITVNDSTVSHIQPTRFMTKIAKL